MGLDMYLKADSYLSGYDFGSDEEQGKYRALLESLGATGFASTDTPSATVSVTIGYWRKANAIHTWFVDNVQNGVDDCGSYYVGREQLQELRDTCQKVLDSLKLEPGKVSAGQVLKDGVWENILEDGQVASNTALAEELLPSGSGFFFGSTEYDEWYADGLKSTIEQIDHALANVPEDWSFEYQSSW